LATAFAFLCCGKPPAAKEVSLAKPKVGFQLVVGPFTVPGASEVQDCYYFRAPADTWVTKFEIAQNPGSHHMNMFRVSEPAAFDNGQVQRGCWDNLPFQEWGLVINSQLSSQTSTGAFEWQLPDGIASHIKAGELLMIQTHYVNASTQKTQTGLGKVVINFHGMDPQSVRAEMGTMFANNRNLFLRAGQEASYTSVCPVPDAVTLLAVTGHFHSRGREFTVAVTDPSGNAGPQIYRSTQWDNPPFTTYADGSEPVVKGGGLEYTCRFKNPLDYDIVFGPHVEFEEHCNLFAFYYPRLEAAEHGALYCF
jgi:hypothetical protein